MILIAVICTNSYDYKTFIAGFQFAEGVNIQFKAVVTAHDAYGQYFAGYYLTPAASRKPDAVELFEVLDARLRKVEAVIYDHGDQAYVKVKSGRMESEKQIGTQQLKREAYDQILKREAYERRQEDLNGLIEFENKGA